MGGRGGDGGGGSAGGSEGGPAESVTPEGHASMDNIEAVAPGFYDSSADASAGGSGASKEEKQARQQILRAYHVPDRLVRVYRPIGNFRDIREFQSGRGIDVNHAAYVTTSEHNATQRAGPGGSVATFQTEASNLSTDGSGSLHDWSYNGPDRSNVGESDAGRVNRKRG